LRAQFRNTPSIRSVACIHHGRSKAPENNVNSIVFTHAYRFVSREEGVVTAPPASLKNVLYAIGHKE
jgi:hypothetical protein